MRLIGEKFSVSCFDGYAHYEVTEDDGGPVVTIERQPQIDGQYGDIGYTAPLLGERCQISRENVEEAVARDKRLFRRG